MKNNKYCVKEILKLSLFILIIKGEIAIPIKELQKTIKYEWYNLVIFTFVKFVNVIIIIKANVQIIEGLFCTINSLKQIIIKIK